MTEKIKTLDGAIRDRARREWNNEVERVLGIKSAAYQLIVNLPGYTGLHTAGGDGPGDKTKDNSFHSALLILTRRVKEAGYAKAEDFAIDQHLRTVADLKNQVAALGDLDRPRYDEEGEPIF
jgi:hypothetical protein